MAAWIAMVVKDDIDGGTTGRGKALIAVSLFLLAACIVSVVLTAGNLPDPLASQVDLEGNPTSWMGQGAFLRLFLFFLVGLNALLWTMRTLVHVFPDRWLSVPWKKYWFATPERRSVAIRRMKVILVGQTGAFLNAMLLLGYDVIYEANVPGAWPVYQGGVFLVYVGIGTLAFLAWVMLYMKPPKSGHSSEMP